MTSEGQPDYRKRGVAKRRKHYGENDARYDSSEVENVIPPQYTDGVPNTTDKSFAERAMVAARTCV